MDTNNEVFYTSKEIKKVNTKNVNKQTAELMQKWHVNDETDQSTSTNTDAKIQKIYVWVGSVVKCLGL